MGRRQGGPSRTGTKRARILKRYVTDEQCSRRPIFIATLWAVVSWQFFLRRGGSLRISQDTLVARALKNSQLTGGETYTYFGDKTLRAVPPSPFGAEIAHHHDDAVADVEDAIVEFLELPGLKTTVVTHLVRSFDGGRYSS